MSRMDEKRLDKLEATQDDIKTTLSSIDKTLAVNTTLLDEHIERSNRLEALLNKEVTFIHAEIEPIKTHITGVKGFFKYTKYLTIAIGSVATLLGILTTLGIL